MISLTRAMEGKLSEVARRLTPSPIQELSHLAQRCGAINLAEGYPDFPAPLPVKQAAISAINDDLNQYRESWVSPSFERVFDSNEAERKDVQGVCDLLAMKMKESYSLDTDPLTDYVISCGQTEAFAATVFAIIDRGDEVLLFDPAYETYETSISLAGGVPVYVALDPPHWSLNMDKFMKSFTMRTKAVILNSPHNPTGKVFTKEELEVIAGACCNMNCFVITDEVYEYITYDKQKHICLASLPGMQERTIVTSSLSKTFSVTGWRIGWACAPTNIASTIRNIHIKITDSAPAPFQEAALTALKSPRSYYMSLRTEYEARRDYIVKVLSELGFEIQCKPQGSVFIFAKLPKNWLHSDVDFVRALIQKAGVAAVPGCGFFHIDTDGESYKKKYIRFAFCKSEMTLVAAAQKMLDLVNSEGALQLE